MVTLWWVLLSVVGAINIILWALTLKKFLKARISSTPDVFKFQKWQIILSGGYVFGCAFRSFLPRADVQRICLYDSWLSSVVVGRAVATVAELCFMAQGALFLYWISKDAGALFSKAISKTIVPIIAVAEVFSWYSVLTTDYIGNTVEESLWTLSSILLFVGVLFLVYESKKLRKYLVPLAVGELGYVLFMCLVDVPMYFSRWKLDQAQGKKYLSLGEGLWNASHVWIVTTRWEDWRTEIPWMSFYFSMAVWLSIALAGASLYRFNRPVSP